MFQIKEFVVEVMLRNPYLSRALCIYTCKGDAISIAVGLSFKLFIAFLLHFDKKTNYNSHLKNKEF